MKHLENEMAFGQMSEFDLHRLQCKLKKELDSNPNIKQYKGRYNKNNNTIDIYIQKKSQINQITTNLKFF